MLARVLEPEVMDTPEEASDYDAMDHAAVNRAFAEDFLAAWNHASPVLDVGTGTAQIPIELCRQSDAVRLVAIDLADHMLALARANGDRAGLADRLLLYRAPIVVGGGLTLPDIGLERLGDAHGQWRLADSRRLGVDRLDVYERP